jgi:hypothetical protein
VSAGRRSTKDHRLRHERGRQRHQQHHREQRRGNHADAAGVAGGLRLEPNARARGSLPVA